VDILAEVESDLLNWANITPTIKSIATTPTHITGVGLNAVVLFVEAGFDGVGSRVIPVGV
jgi:hypothetical protein